MLKNLRHKKTAKKIWVTAIILILPAFLFWGIETTVRSQKEFSYAGTIGGRKVSLLEYRDAVHATRNQLIMRFGDNSSQIEKYVNLQSEAWDRLVLLEEVKRRNTKVSDREVIESIERYPLFQRKAKFDNRLYTEAMQYVFHTQPRIFEEETRQNLTLLKLYKEITDKITVEEKEIAEAYRKFNEEISLYYIVAAPSDFEKEVSASEDSIKEYFARHALEFKQPTSFNVEYIVVAAQEKIKPVRPLLRKKYGWNIAAKKIGAEIKETGLFPETGAIPGIGWAPQVASIISKLHPAQVSMPVELDNKIYLFRLKERKEPYMPDLETIKDKVKEALIKQESRQAAKEEIENCLKDLKEEYRINLKGIDFDRIAKKYGLKSDVTPPFKYGSYIEGIGASDNFWMEAKLLKEDEPSSILDMPSGFYLIKVKSSLPIDAQKFEAEKVEFTQRLLLEEKEEFFRKFLADLKRKARMF